MATIRQIEANRRNAQSSTGPRTGEGKTAARFNSLKSGIHAAEQIIPGEDLGEFQAYARDLTASSNPSDAREQQLVDQMIAHGWRLRRLLKAEPQAWSRVFDALQKCTGYSETTKIADGINHHPAFFLRLQRLITSVEKSYPQAAAALDRLQSIRARSPQPEPVSHQPLTPEIGFVPRISINQASVPAPPSPQPPVATDPRLSVTFSRPPSISL